MLPRVTIERRYADLATAYGRATAQLLEAHERLSALRTADRVTREVVTEALGLLHCSLELLEGVHPRLMHGRYKQFLEEEYRQ